MRAGPYSVTVTVPARIHLGFLDLNGELGRRFGSIGLAITGLRTRVTVSRARRAQIVGPEQERIRRYVERLQAFLEFDGPLSIRLDEAVPPHAGLGSGTQLALALAAAVRELNGLPLDTRGDAYRLGRGRRSGIGIALFDSGGVVVDGGRAAESRAAPVVSRIPFPENWRILLVLDPARSGVHGEDESAAFARLSPLPGEQAGRICRLVLMQALPALVEADLPAFAAAIKEMQQLLGAHFAPWQGGHAFMSRDVEAALALLEGEGALGIGQSSWGPTGFAFAPSQAEAERLVAFARRHPRCRGLDIRICQGLNRGAQIAAGTVAAVTNL